MVYIASQVHLNSLALSCANLQLNSPFPVNQLDDTMGWQALTAKSRRDDIDDILCQPCYDSLLLWHSGESVMRRGGGYAILYIV